MAPRYALAIINKLLQNIMENEKPFRGKIFVLGSDFQQLLPVMLHGTRLEVVDLLIKSSVLWKNFNIFKLKTIMRTLPKEMELANFLLDLGDEILNDNNDCVDLNPPKYIANNNSNYNKSTLFSSKICNTCST